MLNSMYTIFDDVANRFDVYKVATIGDAYMVASGVPLRNGTRHASEICEMAAALVLTANKLYVPHLPNERLRMRCGVHSGSCVAGVAGIKMPRYLLFGDTVNLASKMESTGEPMKIHISEATEKLLRNSGGEHFYIIKYRGEVAIKGNVIQTFWYEGKRCTFDLS